MDEMQVKVATPLTHTISLGFSASEGCHSRICCAWRPPCPTSAPRTFAEALHAIALLRLMFLGALHQWKRSALALLHLLPGFVMKGAEMVSGQPIQQWLFSRARFCSSESPHCLHASPRCKQEASNPALPLRLAPTLLPPFLT